MPQLDELLWGVHKQEVITIGARTSVGKTAFITHLLYNLADSNKTIIDFTTEMTEEQMCERLFTHACKVNNIDLRKGRAKKEFEDKKETFRDWSMNVNVLLTNKYSRKFSEAVRVCKKINPDFVIIDYIQMVGDTGDKKKDIEEFLYNIKNLGIDMDFGIINVSQVNREGASAEENKRPYMHQLKYAGVLEEHSDTVVLLHWNFKTNEYFIYVEKQRHGEPGVVQVEFLPWYNEFKEYHPDIPIVHRTDWGTKE